MIILGCMYIGYAALFMCRKTIVISGPAMLEDPMLGLTKTAWGAILGWGTAGTVVGKLINGVLADRLGGRHVFILSLAFCILATTAFGTVSGVLFFSIAYFVALFGKSAGWPAMANLIRIWYPQNWRGRIWGIISSSSRFSSVATTLGLGSLFLVISWQGVIATAVAIASIVLLVIIFILKQSPKDAGLEATAEEKAVEIKPHPLDDFALSQALLYFAKSSRVWLICLSIACLTVLFEFQSFIPIYLKETFGLTAGIAVITSSAFPIGCLISALLGGFVFDVISKRTRIFVLGGMMIFSVLCLASLLLIPSLGLTHTLALWTTLIAIMLFGVAISPCYYIPMSVFSVDFGGVRCGILVGIIDAIGYSFAMAFDFIGGAVADRADGWSQFLSILLAVSAVGAVTLSLFLILEHRAEPLEFKDSSRMK
ncbi:MAG TPA: MFS transporter [Nitrospinaceae bacterium]|nr:MFS transporter [Nitrospinaceae bacterium]